MIYMNRIYENFYNLAILINFTLLDIIRYYLLDIIYKIFEEFLKIF